MKMWQRNGVELNFEQHHQNAKPLAEQFLQLERRVRNATEFCRGIKNCFFNNDKRQALQENRSGDGNGGRVGQKKLEAMPP